MTETIRYHVHSMALKVLFPFPTTNAFLDIYTVEKVEILLHFFYNVEIIRITYYKITLHEKSRNMRVTLSIYLLLYVLLVVVKL